MNKTIERVCVSLTEDWPAIIGFPLAFILMFASRGLTILFVPPKYWEFDDEI